MKDTLLCLSGGLDSASLLFEYKDRIAMAVTFDYGSIQNKTEQKYAKELADRAGVPWMLIDVKSVFRGFKSALLSSKNDVPSGVYTEENQKELVVPFRNGIFLSILAGIADSKGLKYVALASHSNDNCFTEDTKFLTPDGIRSLFDLEIGDKIFSFNTETNKIEVDNLTDIVEVGANDEIYKIQTSGGNLELTAEHQVYRLKLGDYDRALGFNKSIEKVAVKDLTTDDMLIQPIDLTYEGQKKGVIDVLSVLEDIKDRHNASFKIFTANDKVWINHERYERLAIPRYMETSDLGCFLSWYITEGSSRLSGFSGNNSSGTLYRAEFSQSLSANPEKVDLIDRIIRECNLPVTHQFSAKLHNNRPQMVNYYFSNALSVLAKDCGSCASEKRIPDWLMEALICDYEARVEFIENMILGDGYQGITTHYISKSRTLIEQFKFLLHISGFSVTETQKGSVIDILICKKGRKSATMCLGDAHFIRIKSIEKEIRPQTKVYDITVEKNHNFFAGINGFTLISNSVYPDCRPEFSDVMSEAIRLGTDNEVEFFRPYVEISKREVAKRGIAAGLNPDWTYSCYKGETTPCGECPTCKDRAAALEGLSW